MDTLMPPDQQQAALSLALSLAIGLLFGLERGWHKQQPEYVSRPAGVRTFALIGLLGGVAGLLALRTTPALLGWAFAAFAAAAVAAHVLNARKTGETGTTTLIAELLAFGLAALATLDNPATAASAAVVAALLLGLKPQLHGWIAKLDETELRATLQLLLISVVMLPMLPDAGLGPANALNPYELWWMVVLIAAISYVGYFAVRIAGADAGIPLTGLLAGLASSTALTLQMARLARNDGRARNLLAAGILLANATLFPRILVIVGLVQPGLIRSLGVPLAVMTLITVLPALPFWLRRDETSGPAPVQTQNPLALGSALRIGALLAVVMVLSRIAAEHFGDTGVLALAGVSGLADLNAVTLSVARMVPDDVSVSTALLAILLAITSNAVFKTGVCWSVGTAGLALRVGTPLLAACAAGLGLPWLAAQLPMLPAPLDAWLPRGDW
jgi:uncharacterized membrane protein (DUF4010 family)